MQCMILRGPITLFAILLAFQNVSLDDVVDRRGPMALGNRAFTIVKHYKRIHGRSDPDAQTLARVEIVPADGGESFHEDLPFSLDRGEFQETCDADVDPLNGSNGRGFLVTSGCLPSAPMSGGPWLVLGLAGDAIVPIGKPIVAEGERGDFVAGAMTRIGTATRILPDALQIRVWTGYFFVDVPIRIDWNGRQLGLAQRCFEMRGRGAVEGGCEYPATGIERGAQERDLTFVRLFGEARESIGVPEHIVVRRDSRVEFLATKVRVTREDLPDSIGLGVDDDIWLKVRIDGVEGWIHTLEDFNALGLHPSG
jgi:hypothetical protein